MLEWILVWARPIGGVNSREIYTGAGELGVTTSWTPGGLP